MIGNRRGSVSVINAGACALFAECWIRSKPYGSRAESSQYNNVVKHQSCRYQHPAAAVIFSAKISYYSHRYSRKGKGAVAA